jgi:CSLREA domain-containing protein
VLLVCAAGFMFVCPGEGVAGGPSGVLALDVPTIARVGQPIDLVLRYAGGGAAAGYQADLLYDTNAAHLTYVDNRGDSGPAVRGWDVRDLGPVELEDGVAFGGYSCLAPDCAGGGQAAGRAGGGGGPLARIEVRADEPGPLELRLTDAEVVDPSGDVIASIDDQTVTIDVSAEPGNGNAGGHAAPGARRGRKPSTTHGHVRDATGDGHLDDADVTEAALSWVVAHTDGGTCGPGTTPAADANGDGCVDVADVQTFAGAAGRPAVKFVGPSPVAPGRGSPASGARTSSVSGASTFVVNSTGDGNDAAVGNGVCATSTNACTLRAAIQEANALPGADAIHFAIGSGLQTIQLVSTLPTISDRSGGVTIDGYTQPGAVVNSSAQADNAQIKVQVRGTGPTGVNGLQITSGANTIRGIAFYNLRRPIYIYGSAATGNAIVGCFVGTDAGGAFAHTTTDTYASGIAIEAGAANNKVGTTALADRNVVSGNARHGIVTYNEGSNSNLIYNNIIGLSPNGFRRLPNLKHGIDINAGSSFNQIGGTSVGMRNVISGNGIGPEPGDAAIEVSHATTTTGNKIIGNYIGTDVTGATAASWTYNFYWGIHIEDGVNNTTVSNNVIVASRGGGVRLQDVGTTKNQITDNRIGLTATDQSGANGLFGVLVSTSATGNTIGPGNTIANNPIGVWIRDPNTDGNRITRNSIYSNTGLGIDLDPNAQVNINDPGDSDTGPNEQLNFPVITSAQATSVTGTACPGCTVELFVADSNGPGTAGGPGAGAYGEGRTYLTATTASGGGQFTTAISGVSNGQWVTATATDSAGNTSEFSENVKVGGTVSAPGAPSLTGATASGDTITLQWNPPASSGGTPITSYRIYRGTASGAETFLVQVGNISNYIDVNVSVGTTYWYKVSAVNAVGEGPLSNELSATPGGNIIVSDRFERTVASGLGSADVGGAWSVSSTSRTKVQNGEAVVYGWTGGGQDVRAWREDVRQNMELLGLVRLNATNPTGGSYKPRLVARAQADTRNGYYASISHTTAGAVTWQLSRIDNAGGTGSLSLANGTLVSSGGGGTRWWIRLRVQGTSIQVRYWRDGTTQPSTWTASTTDSYFASGRASFGVSTGTGLTAPFPDAGFTSFNAVDLSATP